MGWLNSVLRNQDIMLWVMALAVFVFTQILKLPIKYFTNKIKNEKTRKAVNSVILIIPFTLGIVCELLYSKFVLKTAFDVVNGIIIGGQSMALYGIVERLFGVKIPNEIEELENGKEILDTATKVALDGNITPEEAETILETIKGKKSDKKPKKEEKTETPKEVQDFIDKMDLGSK